MIWKVLRREIGGGGVGSGGDPLLGYTFGIRNIWQGVPSATSIEPSLSARL